MAEAAITTKLAPSEFDAVRAALDIAKDAMIEKGKDNAFTSPERREANQRAVQFDTILQRFNA